MGAITHFEIYPKGMSSYTYPHPHRAKQSLCMYIIYIYGDGKKPERLLKHGEKKLRCGEGMGCANHLGLHLNAFFLLFLVVVVFIQGQRK